MQNRSTPGRRRAPSAPWHTHARAVLTPQLAIKSVAALGMVGLATATIVTPSVAQVMPASQTSQASRPVSTPTSGAAAVTAAPAAVEDVLPSAEVARLTALLTDARVGTTLTTSRSGGRDAVAGTDTTQSAGASGVVAVAEPVDAQTATDGQATGSSDSAATGSAATTGEAATTGDATTSGEAATTGDATTGQATTTGDAATTGEAAAPAAAAAAVEAAVVSPDVAGPVLAQSVGITGISAVAKPTPPPTPATSGAVANPTGALGACGGKGLTSNAAGVCSAVVSAYGNNFVIGGARAGGGDHGAGRAVDIMVTGATGDDIAAFLQNNSGNLRIKYLIWKQRYWAPGGSWRMMADRGSITQNHYDHVHVSVY